MSSDAAVPSLAESVRETRWVFAGLAVLVAFHVLVNIWWLRQDNAPQVGDPGSHLEAAKIYYRVLTNPNEPNLIKRVADIRHVPLRFYPPLTYILGAFAATLFGPDTAGFAMLNTFVFAALILASYAAARVLMRPAHALFAAFTVSMTPFLFGISRLFLLDLLSAFFAVVFFVVLLKTEFFSRRPWIFLLAVVNILGFWTRWTTPLYYAVPVAVCILYGLVDDRRCGGEEGRSRARSRVANACLFMAVSVMGIGAWFMRSTEDLGQTYSQNFAPLQKQVSLFDPMIWLSYPIIVNNAGTFLLLSILAVAGIAVGLLQRPLSRTAVLLVSWPVSSILLLTILAVVRNHAPRYIVPALVPLGILAALALCAIPQRRARLSAFAVTAILLLVQFVHVTAAPFGGVTRLDIPFPTRLDWQSRDGDEGIVVFAGKVDASGAKYGPPFRGENWIERALDGIVEADRASYSVRNQDAKILLVGVRRESISNVQRDYWPVVDPLRDPTRVRRVVGYFVRTTPGAPVDSSDYPGKGGDVSANFERIPQPRPVALNEVLPDFDRVTEESLERVEYVIWATHERVDELPALLSDFERLNAFEAGVFGHWAPRHFQVLWRKPRNVIALETCDTLQITTTGDSAEARWDVPWYRYPWWTAVDNPEGIDHWAAGPYATVEAVFGGTFAVDGIEIAPYSAETAPGIVRGEYWSTEEGRWEELAPNRIVVSDPIFAEGERVMYHHPYPEPWADSVETGRIRLTFESDGPIGITNIFVYHE